MQKLSLSCFNHHENVYSSACVRVQDADSLRPAIMGLGLKTTEWTRGWIWPRTTFFTECRFDDIPRIDRVIQVWRKT